VLNLSRLLPHGLPYQEVTLTPIFTAIEPTYFFAIIDHQEEEPSKEAELSPSGRSAPCTYGSNQQLEPMFQNIDASTKLPDTPMADQFFEDDDLESEQSETEFDMETTHLVTHAKVYAIAEKYVLPFVIVFFSTFCLNAVCGLRGCFICACSSTFHGWGVQRMARFKHRQTPRFASLALCLANHTSCCTPHCTFAYTALSSVFFLCTISHMDQLPTMMIAPSWLHFRNSPRQRTTPLLPITRLSCITRTMEFTC
jgi:hypothetical protein